MQYSACSGLLAGEAAAAVLKVNVCRTPLGLDKWPVLPVWCVVPGARLVQR